MIKTSSESEYWRGVVALCSIPSCQPTTWWQVHDFFVVVKLAATEPPGGKCTKKPFLVKSAGKRPETKLPAGQLVASTWKTILVKPHLPPGSDPLPQVEATQFVSSELGRPGDQFREQPLEKQINTILISFKIYKKGQFDEPSESWQLHPHHRAWG